jgi:methylmalonyl-CoA mutase
MKDNRLFSQFPPVTTNEWMDKIRSDLKGAEFNKKMVWRTSEGFDVKPFYRMEDTENLMYMHTLPGEYPYIRGAGAKNNNWSIRQDIEVTDYTAANLKALSLPGKGVDSLGFIIKDPESVSERNLRILLSSIDPVTTGVNFLCNGKAREILDILIIIARENGTAYSSAAIEADPLNRLLLNGTLCIPEEEAFDYLAGLTRSASLFPGFRTIHLNAASFKNAGAGIVQELAFALSAGSEYLAQLTAKGLSAVMAASAIRFSFGAGGDYFPEIAKLRAARLLWSVVLNGFLPGTGESIKMDIHSVTTRWNKTLYDPYVNLLRTQTEAMAAVTGGTDSLTVEPYDITFRQPDEFSERIARNQQLILREESSFGSVADPSAGSYYIENLTRLIAEKSWDLFVAIDEMGGFLQAVKSGYIREKLSRAASAKRSDIATRKRVLLGTNQYPDRRESLSPAADTARIFAERDEERIRDKGGIVLFRGSEEYDRLRVAVDRSPSRPQVFLLSIGDRAKRMARAQFSSAFFGCAGYCVLENDGFDDPEEGIVSALESKAGIVVICSSDEDYSVFAPYIYSKLRDKAIVVIAGNPPLAEELKEKGLTWFIHKGSDLPAIIRQFNSMLGIDQ